MVLIDNISNNEIDLVKIILKSYPTMNGNNDNNYD